MIDIDINVLLHADEGDGELWNPMVEDYLSERNSYQVDVDDPGVATVGYSQLILISRRLLLTVSNTFRSTPKSRPNNVGQMSVRPSVHKKFFRFR